MGRITGTYFQSSILWAVFILLTLTSCRSIKPIEESKYKNFKPVDIAPRTIIDKMPGNERPLRSVKGKGKALISTPDRSDRVTLHFAGNRDTSHISVQNRIGMNGGELMATGDSILVYDKIEQKAHKISLEQAHSTQINSLASTNLVEVLDYRITAGQVKKVFVNQQYYLLVLVDNTQVQVSRSNYQIMSVKLPAGTESPYNSIQYEAYSPLKDYSLPRKITITSANQKSRVTLLVQSVTPNPSPLDLSIDLPDKITVQRL